MGNAIEELKKEIEQLESLLVSRKQALALLTASPTIKKKGAMSDDGKEGVRKAQKKRWREWRAAQKAKVRAAKKAK